ncbi:MAG: hypothetical protein HYV09_26380 [Deltaproteobacteria bacterium]|nr:hypothetical protein [Deltaproteobacteria bacterium]
MCDVRGRVRSPAIALALTIALAATTARSEPRKHPTLAPVTAVVPGALVHGSGHFVAGHTTTAKRLLITETIGLALVVGSLGGLAATGASRYTVTPLAVGAVVGFDLFALSFLADVYGTTAPDGGTGAPLRTRSRLESEVGVRAVHDPQFPYGAVAVQRLDLREGRVRLSPSAWQAPRGGAGELSVLVSARLVGPGTRPEDTRHLAEPQTHPADGSFLDAELVGGHRGYLGDGFSTTWVEWRASGRLDLHHVGSTLRGSFAELQLGAALATHRYSIGASERDVLLLTRIGWGMYVGRGLSHAGEVTVFYDHRRDTITGGMLLPGIGAGYLGFAGFSARYFLDRTFGVAAEGLVGSAWIGGVSLVVRQAGRAW